MEMVGELVDDEVVASGECREHALAFDDERLRDVEAYGEDDEHRQHKEDRNLFERASEELHAVHCTRMCMHVNKMRSRMGSNAPGAMV